MDCDQLRSFLNKKYNLVCFEDLAKFRESHSAIFNFLANCWQSEFENNQRLVFYSSYNPEQEYLNHIQRAISKINIGNFFVLLITPFDIANKLRAANDSFGYNEFPITCSVLCVTQSKPFKSYRFAKDYNAMCPLPFLQTTILGNSVYPCCDFVSSTPIGETNLDSLSNIFKSRRMDTIREKMLHGEKLPECSRCWIAEAQGSVSLRNHMLNKFSDNLDFGLIDNPTLKSVEISPQSTCNFTCRICNFISSSKIAQEELKYAQTPEEKNSIKKIINLAQVDQELLLNDLENLAKDIEEIHLLGGEPFLWKPLSIFLKKLIKNNYAKNIKIIFNTNGSVYKIDVINLLRQFKSVEILISIDDIGRRFEIQRGGDWKSILNNLKLFSNLKSNSFSVKIAIVVNIQNLLYLDELVEFCELLEFEIVWWYLKDPSSLCIDFVTKDVQQLVKEKYQNHPNPELQAIKRRVTAREAANGSAFIEYMNKLDTRRLQNFRECHQEIFDAMSG